MNKTMVSTDESVIRVNHSRAVEAQSSAVRIIDGLKKIDEILQTMLEEDMPSVWETMPVVGIVELQGTARRLLDKAKADKAALDKRALDIVDKLRRIKYRVTIYDMGLAEVESCVFETKEEAGKYADEDMGKCEANVVVEEKHDGVWKVVYDTRDYTYANDYEKARRSRSKKTKGGNK